MEAIHEIAADALERVLAVIVDNLFRIVAAVLAAVAIACVAICIVHVVQIARHVDAQAAAFARSASANFN